LKPREAAPTIGIVNEPADGDGSTGDPPDPPALGAPAPEPAEATPAASAPAAPAPSAAATAASLHAMTAVSYPDDGPVSSWLRHADRTLGVIEQAVLFLLLSAVVLTAAAAALSDRVLGHSLGRWWFDIVRGGTFSIAMIGAVFASHQQRHLSMDLVSRRLPPRGRLVLRVILALFTIMIAALLVRAGSHLVNTVGGESGDHLISTHTIVTFLPIGAVLIIVHTILHMAIDIDYLARRKTPPERMRSGH
jgi:TRAP-type C4-dicarboxylate transport system permease small subunit